MTKTHFSSSEARDALARRFLSHRLFRRMIARQGIDLESIAWPGAGGAIYRSLHACAHCPAKARCAGWLAGAEAPARYALFCPNAQAIETLRIMAR